MARRAEWAMLRIRNVAEEQQLREGRIIYVVRMRNIADLESGDWATFVKEGRREAKLTQERLAGMVGVNRTTVWRWENEGMKPENVAMALAVAEALDVDDELALKAAALAKIDTPQRKPHPLVLKYNVSSDDPIVRKILAAPVDEATREDMFAHYRRRLDEAGADIDWMQRHARREDAA